MKENNLYRLVILNTHVILKMMLQVSFSDCYFMSSNTSQGSFIIPFDLGFTTDVGYSLRNVLVTAQHWPCTETNHWRPTSKLHVYLLKSICHLRLTNV